MPVVTLTTDWGNRDYYLASFKGMLASNCLGAHVIDISNDVDHFDILQASFILKNCFRKFPEGTIHYIGVRGNETRKKSRGYLLVECENHFFIGYDNGVFSLALDDSEKRIFHTGIDAEAPDHEIQERIVEIICLLARGETPQSFCEETDEVLSVINSRPSFDNDSIRGTIIYIDSFQNVVSNISRELFDRVAGERTFTIVVRNHECKFRKICNHYTDADMGEPVCLFNEKGMLELALNGANAAGLLGIKVLDNIRIEFHGVVRLPQQEDHLPTPVNTMTEK